MVSALVDRSDGLWIDWGQLVVDQTDLGHRCGWSSGLHVDGILFNRVSPMDDEQQFAPRSQLRVRRLESAAAASGVPIMGTHHTDSRQLVNRLLHATLGFAASGAIAKTPTDSIGAAGLQ